MTSHLCFVMQGSPVDKATGGPWDGKRDHCRKRAMYAVLWGSANNVTYVCHRHMEGYRSLGEDNITPLNYEIEEEPMDDDFLCKNDCIPICPGEG